MSITPPRHFLGILQIPDPELNNVVPGTVVMLEQELDHENQPDIALKKSSQGIILNPQPRDNPNDPLNWPTWKRDVALLVLGFHCLVGGGQTPILAAGFKTLAKQFHVSITAVAHTTGFYMLTLGIGSVFASPTAIIYGKRMVYLIGIIIFFISSIWASRSQSYSSLLGARIVMGFGVSPVECLPSATIAEIYFLHERAYRVGIYTLLLLGGKNLVPLVSAAIINSLGWRWVFYTVAIIVGMNFVLTFLFVPETFWDRSPKPDSRSLEETLSARKLKLKLENFKSGQCLQNEKTGNPTLVPPGIHLHFAEDERSDRHSQALDIPSLPTKEEPQEASHFVRPPNTSNVRTLSGRSSMSLGPISTTSAAVPPKTFREQLTVFSGRHVSDSWIKVALRPFVLFAYPAVLYSTLVYSLSIVWLIVMSETVGQVYQNDPYRFSSLSTGLVYISPFISGILGTAVAGKVSDIFARILTRRNHGVYEPEYRLIMILPVALSVTIGLFGFGWSAQQKDAWIVPTLFFGVISFGCSLGSTTAITFTVDSYRPFAGEALVTLNLTKNLAGFAFSLFTNNFIDRDGTKTVFLTFGGIQLFVCLLGIPMYVFGKRARHWTDKAGMMNWLYTK
ncbi:putative MFS-type transporter [Neolecta irregularis DAH-3]|uniref:Putative MFS-type transporter n=1 Tax=Neolecta irregularis (strain DAH-3) TaxID=1198029 RepID=A0A1U7LR68_NEOID|nr:putative MFS-type transporter [Neolecta irregularis DAH-3]|eukprot:OLL25166.1 putative MFS-type transporter [Neolecta irregularis DAH-3]